MAAPGIYDSGSKIPSYGISVTQGGVGVFEQVRETYHTNELLPSSTEGGIYGFIQPDSQGGVNQETETRRCCYRNYPSPLPVPDNSANTTFGATIETALGAFLC